MTHSIALLPSSSVYSAHINMLAHVCSTYNSISIVQILAYIVCMLAHVYSAHISMSSAHVSTCLWRTCEHMSVVHMLTHVCSTHISMSIVPLLARL